MTLGRILAVDDEEFNLDILGEYLSNADFEVISARNGHEALNALERYPDIDVVVLDRMMPKLNGMEVLQKIKASEAWQHIPVVMQTAAGTNEQVAEGIRAGAYYYLVKPYEESLLLATVKAALSDARQRRNAREEIHHYQHGIALLKTACFHFRTLQEARDLADFVASCFPALPTLKLGLAELAINAIEHGNLGISYRDKSALLLSDTWESEVLRRQDLPENRGKFAELVLSVAAGELTIELRDQGAGFDWRSYQEFSPERATDPHGRGIAMARMLAFGNLEYLGKGNEVRCRVPLGEG